MEIVLYALAGLALLALLVLAGIVVSRQQGPGPAEPAVPPDPFEAPAAPAPEEVEIATVDEETLEREALEAPEEGDGVPRPPPPGIDDLIARIRSGDPVACREAVDALVGHGESALPALEAALDDPDPDVRLDLRKAIDRIRS